jgi:hypothetical protein
MPEVYKRLKIQVKPIKSKLHLQESKDRESGRIKATLFSFYRSSDVRYIPVLSHRLFTDQVQ